MCRAGRERVLEDAEHLQQDDDADRHAAEPEDDAFHEGLLSVKLHPVSHPAHRATAKAGQESRGVGVRLSDFIPRGRGQACGKLCAQVAQPLSCNGLQRIAC